MGALTKQQKAAQTRKANTKATKPYWTKADRIKLITQDKIDIIDHPATNKVYIGGKDGGKSRSAAVAMITAMETNKDAMGLALKKYKHGGIQRLHVSYQNVALEIANLGYNIPEYDKGVNETYRMHNWKYKSKNQMIEYSSFDDANGLAGIEAKNLGFFAVVHIEEPVLIDDEGKLPTPQEWKAAMSTIKKSVARSNRKYLQAHPHDDVGSTQYFYTMNPWDNHPIINLAEEIFPEQDFLNWVMNNYFKNHTKPVLHQESDTLYIRTTTLSNPVINMIEQTLKHFKVRNLEEWNKLDKEQIDWESPALTEFGINEHVVKAHIQGYDGLAIWFQIEEAIRCGDSLMLASLLGLKYQGSAGNQKVWNMEYAHIGDTDKFLRRPDIEVKGLSVGWDIDLRPNRGLVATPIYYVEQIDDLDRCIGQMAVVGKQQLVHTYGDAGDIKYSYWQNAKTVLDSIKDYTESLQKMSQLTNGPMIYVDENKQDLVFEFKKHNRDFWKGIRKAVKHGHWDIENRQRAIQTALVKGFIMIDESNRELIRTMTTSYIKEGQKKRDESGRNEKEYDWINSFEYGYYPMYYIPVKNDFKPIQIKKEV